MIEDFSVVVGLTLRFTRPSGILFNYYQGLH